MNKEEFLSQLRKKLSILEESEIEDILSEYEGYIEEKINKGSTEEEAVASMGNVDELAKELLSAYKIKSPGEKTKDTFNTIVDGCITTFERIVDVFAHKSFQEILRFILELVFIFVIIAICKLPFEIIESMGRSAFYALGGGAFRVLAHIWEFILEFVYLIFAVLFFIKIFESRYLEDFNSRKVSNKETKKEEVVIEKKEKDKKEREKKTERVRKEREENTRNFSVVDSLVDLCLLFFRMIAFFILIGVIFYVVGMSITIGLAFYFIIKGVFYFGVYLILFALFLLGILAFISLYNFVFKHKTKGSVLLILSLISFLLLGVGVGVCAIEFAGTTIVYNDETNRNAKETFTYPMKDNLVLGSTSLKENIVFDESLDNEIQFEYLYDDTYYKIEAKPHIEKNDGFEVFYYWYDIKHFVYDKKYLDDFLKHLREKTIRISGENVSVTLKMSKATYDKLMANEEKYGKRVDRDATLEDICEEIRDLGYTLPKHCYSHHNEM